jgi:hypothetical protein
MIRTPNFLMFATDKVEAAKDFRYDALKGINEILRDFF